MDGHALTLVFPDGKRLHVRQADGVPREGDHALALGVYYRVEAVVWQFGRELQDGDRTIPALATEVYLQPAATPPDVEREQLDPSGGGAPRRATR